MILLDTHAALWLLADPGRLSEQARHRISTSAGCYFSAVSIAECMIKQMIGRLDVNEDLTEALKQSGLIPLPLLPEHSAALDRFPELARHDPFDRLLLAQALTERCTLLTADRRLLALGYDWMVAAD